MKNWLNELSRRSFSFKRLGFDFILVMNPMHIIVIVLCTVIPKGPCAERARAVTVREDIKRKLTF